MSSSIVDIPKMEYEIYSKLRFRYMELAEGTDNEWRVYRMMEEILYNHNHWPKDKTGRWLGYVQCILIEVEGVTTIEDERDYTRPLFHELYKASGFEIPYSLEI